MILRAGLALLVAAGLAPACDSGGGGGPTADVPVVADPGPSADPGGPRDVPAAADAGPDADPWGFDALIAEYGIIETLAGTGLYQDKGVNGWQPAYEGGPGAAAELSRPHITLGDAAGNLYVADKDAHGIRKITPAGIISTVAGTNVAGDGGDGPGVATEMALSEPNGLWVLADGTLYILDLGNDKVRKVTPDGQLTTLLSIGGAGAGRGLWVADDESSAWIACGSLLKRWTPDGGVQLVASGFLSLGNLVGEPGGTALVTDRLGHRVYRVDALTGAVTPVAGNGTPDGGGDGQAALVSGLDEVRGVWPHPRGGFFVATHKGGQVWFVDPAGILHLFVDGDADDTHAGDGTLVTEPGKKISEPRAVTMDHAGNVLITENDFGYVRRVRRLP